MASHDKIDLGGGQWIYDQSLEMHWAFQELADTFVEVRHEIHHENPLILLEVRVGKLLLLGA